MSYARSPRLEDSMTIGTSMWAISCGGLSGSRSAGGGGGQLGGLGFCGRSGFRERVRLVVFEGRKRRMRGMARQPLVDELLDEPASAQRAPDEASAAL